MFTDHVRLMTLILTYSLLPRVTYVFSLQSPGKASKNSLFRQNCKMQRWLSQFSFPQGEFKASGKTVYRTPHVARHLVDRVRDSLRLAESGNKRKKNLIMKPIGKKMFNSFPWLPTSPKFQNKIMFSFQCKQS